VTGAIGFTEGYDLAGRIRRVHLLDGFYGTAEHLQDRIGRRLVADRSVPRFHPLP
jgi:alkylation response protein AidB-like acyl-CoA dehydrogenase